MNKLSVTIATKNEEENIAKCLESVKWADEIVIVDDNSTDKTVEIAKVFTKNIFMRDSFGDFHKNKNLAIEKATGEWILSLDADEIITPELSCEIQKAIKDKNKLGYYLNRKNYFLGRWIKGCGWYPNYIIRLFKKGTTKWPLEIHDVPQIADKKKVGYLKNPFIHYSYVSLTQYFEKFNLYTTNLSKEMLAKGVRISKRNFFIYFVAKPIFYFFRKYFLWGGYKDGFCGFFISFSSALTVFVMYAKLWELLDERKKSKK